jgi:peptidoglycan DL-endopeptidase CwlO
MTSRTSRSRMAALALCFVALPLASCASDKKSDSSAVAVETTAAAESAAADTEATPETSAAAESASAETEASAETAAADSMAADSAAASDSIAVDPAGSGDASAALLTGLGVTDPKAVECVGKALKGGDLSKASQAGVIKSIMTCAPEALIASAIPAFKESLPTATDEQAKCLLKATFTVMASLPEDELEKAMASSKDMPDAMKSEVKDKAKECGLSESDIDKALNA